MKHLHEKNEQFRAPSKEILDTFDSPGVRGVHLEQAEFTSLCPLTNQPDYGVIKVYYIPDKLCLESKSLKLYLSAYRNVGAFAETITQMIMEDVWAVLKPLKVEVIGVFVRRGGISIEALARREKV
uniref:Putative 7-cyano-7-deazaguanine reductase n=1 Tax=viral metagenome TaxID=1070528 RepID=A0A6M3IPL2_9ZZZZ